MLKLNAKFNADSLFYSLSHFECVDHTVHMLSQYHLPSPLTSTVRSSLFTHAHSSLLSLLLGYIDAMQTILIILTMTWLFLDRPLGAWHGVIKKEESQTECTVSILHLFFFFCRNISGAHGDLADLELRDI